MAVIFVLLPLAVLFALGFVLLFVWAARDGQFDDMNTPQIRVLLDDAALVPGREASPPQAGKETG